MSIHDDIALTTNDYKAEQSEWFIDSAASKHMTFNKNVMMDYTQYRDPTEIFLGDNTVILAEGEGTVRIPMYNNESGEPSSLTLQKVLYAPKLTKNLVSVAAMTNMGAEVYFDKNKCTILKNNRYITIGHALDGKLYRLNNDHAYASFVNTTPSTELWHYRLGHLNTTYVQQLVKDDMVSGMKCTNNCNEFKCEPCILGKMKRASIPKKSPTRSTHPLELVHSDVCGPIEVQSHGGSRYFLTFTDDFSRYTVVYFLKNKSEVLSKFKEYVSCMENKTGTKIKKLNIIRSDNGGEYTSNEFKNYCKELGIAHEFTNPYTPEQNGVSERYNRTVMEAARSMLLHAQLPLSFWAEAVSCASYVRNRSPTSSLSGKTPYECWFGKKPDLSNLRVFGCISYVHIPDELRQKLDPKSVKCVFMGYPEGTKGYKLYNLKTGRFMRSLSVLFCEEDFHDWNEKIERKQYLQLFPENDTYNEEEPTIEDNHDADEDNHQNDLENLADPVQNLVQDVQNVNIPLNYPVGETYEQRFLHETQNVGERRERKATQRFIEELSFVNEYCMMTSLVTETGEPKSVQEALNDNNWYDAMKSEMSSLEKNETWELVPRPEGKNIVGSRWVFKIKRNSDGSVDRYKARLVAQGYSQVQGVDYNEVFSPVARFSAIRTLLAVANTNDFEIHQMDVKTAFLNGSLDYEIYMEQPKGFIDHNKPDHVCKLKKSIYGLKQSARCWNITLHEYLLSEGYSKSDADDCIYIKFIDEENRSYFVILAVYVDDVIPISNNTSLLTKEKSKLQQKFEMVDNGSVHYLLGMLITRDRINKELTISQPTYLDNVLKRFNMENCNPVSTPMETGQKFTKLSDGDTPFTNIQLYQQAVGSLMYAATTTRPDIAASIGILAQYMSAPSECHWSGIKRVLRYIKGTLNYGLCFYSDGEGRTEGNKLVGFSDSDWAGDVDTRRSTSGYTFHVGNSLVSWSSRKQATVAKSSTEAEYVALSFTTQEAIWLRRLLHSIGYTMSSPTKIYEDNQGAIELSRNPKHHNRTKHIDTSFHFTRERVSMNEVKVEYCPTSDMVADIMTKALPRVPFEKFRDLMGVYEIRL